jgi:hypothetical protein
MHHRAFHLIILLLWTCPSLAQTNFSVPFDFCPDQGPTNMISYELHQPGPVKLVVQHIFTNLHVRTLVDDVHSAGMHQVAWDGYDDSGLPLQTGVYVFKLSGDGWEVEQWSALDCGLDAAIQSRVTVGSRDVTMAFANILEESEFAELAVYTADGSIRVKDFSYLNQSHMLFGCGLSKTPQARCCRPAIIFIAWPAPRTPKIFHLPSIPSIVDP